MIHKKHPIFYGWVIAAICFITLSVSSGLQRAFSVFYVAILNEFGWLRSDTAIIYSTAMLIYGLMSPVAGSLVDRFGPKRVLVTGALLLTLGMGGSSQASTIWHFCLIYGVIGALGTSLVGYVPNSTLLSSWFIEKRGAAFGILSAGVGLCSVLIVLAEWLISNVGWETAFLILGAMPVILIIPLVILFVKRQPQDMGLLPDGAHNTEFDEVEVNQQSQSVLVVDSNNINNEWTVSKAIRSYKFWALSLASLCLWGISSAIIMVHQIAFFIGVGYTAKFAAMIAFLQGIISILGNFIGGSISDRIGREITYTFASGGIILAIFLLITINDLSYSWKVYLFAFIFGFNLGCVGPVLTASAADIFHGRNFGAIFGLMELVLALGGVFGPWFAGYVFDTTGNYDKAFIVIILALCVAIICMWIAAPRRENEFRITSLG